MLASNRPLSSETLVLPRMIAPAAFSLATSVASAAGIEFCSAIEPPVVGRPRASIKSSSSTGMPCSGPRDAARARSASSACGLVDRARVERAHGLDRRALGVGQRDPRQVRLRSASRPSACPPSSASCRLSPTPSPARTAASAPCRPAPSASRSPGCSRRARRTAAPGRVFAQRYMLGLTSEAGLRSFVRLLDHVRDADQVALVVRVAVDRDVQRAPLRRRCSPSGS